MNLNIATTDYKKKKTKQNIIIADYSNFRVKNNVEFKLDRKIISTKTKSKQRKQSISKSFRTENVAYKNPILIIIFISKMKGETKKNIRKLQ